MWLGYTKKVLDVTKYLVDTSELFKTTVLKVQNAWVDGITSQPSSYKEWSEFVQNPNASNADVQTNEIVTNCQNNICAAEKVLSPYVLRDVLGMLKSLCEEDRSEWELVR